MREPERRSTRHTGTRSAYSRTECELGTVRYRHLPFEQDLRVSEPLGFAPRSKAMRALPFRSTCTVSGWGRGLRWRLLSEQRAAEEKRRASPPVGHPPEVTDAGKAFWQHMHQEPAQELVVGKSHGAVLALVGVVFPAKSYAVVVDAKQTVVGNGDSMGVTGQVLENVFRTAEWRLGVNHPLLTGDGFEKRCEVLLVGERRALPKESQLMVAKRLPQAVSEFASKNTAEHFHW